MPLPLVSTSITLEQQAIALAERHGVDIPLADQGKVFLETVWQAMPGDALLGLAAETAYWRGGQWNTTVTPRWDWKERIGPDFYDWAAQVNTARYQLPGLGGVYWNTASRKPSVLSRFAGRGALDELLLITSLYCDLDVAKRGYGLEEALQALLDMPIKPTFVVFSGGGLQAIHVMREPWPVLNREAAREYKAYSLAFYNDVYERAGFKLDTSVHEASRMLRLPGTINQKPERAGARARFVYFDPKATITPAAIREAVPLPEPTPEERKSIFAPLGIKEKDTYQVGLEFLNYLVDRQPQPPERHPVILRLAMQAARAGMPVETFVERIRPIARQWYLESPQRAEGELNSMVNWAYAAVAEDPTATATGNWLVKVTASGFERASEEAQDALRDKTQVVDPPVEKPEIAEHSGKIAEKPSLEDLRRDQTRAMRQYAEAKIKGLPTYMLVRTPPGAGKSHSAIQVGYEFALRRGTGQGGRGKVAILTQFQLDEHGWREWLSDFDVADTSRAMYVVARNNDQNSAGYCAMHMIADAVAAKGHNAVAMVCKRCPVEVQCKESWYLSQFNKAKRKDIVIARHQHGVIDLLVDYRRFVIFDESPLGVVAGCIELKADSLVFRPPVVVVDQYAELVDLVAKLLEALRLILAANKPLTGYPTHEHVKLGGLWLMQQLDQQLGPETLDRMTRLDDKVVQQAGQPGYFRLTLEDVAALPQNYLYDLWSIIQYEYRKFYLLGYKRWNSRLIPWAQSLRIYPMRPFSFDPLTKILVTDATGQPDLYTKAFIDSRTKRPRERYVYESDLRPHATIVQWTNSGNSRRAFHRKKHEKITVQDADGQELSFEPEENEPAALARAKEQIKYLAERHQGSLLVVSYMKIHADLKKWVIQTGALKGEYVQYYGNLRGRNDFKHLEAVLLIGEPRIPPMEVFILAQIWHWDDELPIDAELDTKTHKQERYPGYVDPIDGKGRAYFYPGYRDERLNTMYMWAIQAEMRQCYERIRPNAPEIDKATGDLQQKFVYIAAQMPCSDHVDKLGTWTQWHIDEAGRAWYEAQIAAGGTVSQAEYVEATGRPWHTGKASYERVKAQLVAENKIQDTTEAKTKLQIALDWLTDPAHPQRLELSIRDACRQMPDISRSTWERAIKIVRGTGESHLRKSPNLDL